MNDTVLLTTKYSFTQQFKTTLQQKFYASIAIYQPTNQPHHYGAFFQYQLMSALQGDGATRVTSRIQMQAHSKTKKARHHLQPSQLYTVFPIHLKFSHILEHQLTPRDYNQTAGLYTKCLQQLQT